MFVFAVKSPIKFVNKKILAGFFALLFVVLTLTYAGVRTSHNYATTESLGKYSVKVSDNDELNKFLKVFYLSGEPTDKSTIVIPTRFNKTYDKYNALQKQIGMDLSHYKGRCAEKYTISDTKDNATITLLIYSCRIIGGHFQINEDDRIYSLDGEKWNE